MSDPLPLPPSDPVLDEIGRRTLKLDLFASLLFASTQAVLDLGPALAKKGFHATDMQVAWLTSGQSLGLILSFFVADLSLRHRKMPLVFWPEVLRSAALCLVFFVKPTFAIGFVVCHATAQMFQSMTVPARVTIYRNNYPSTLRGKIVGRNRQVQLYVATAVSVVLGLALDGQLDFSWFYTNLGLPFMSAGEQVSTLVPFIGFLGFLGTVAFAFVRVREAPGMENTTGNALTTLRSFVRVWWEDKEFRRYESFFFIFGFANIMTIPLTQIHAVDALHASYLDLALINVAIPQGLMAVTMAFWGKLIDRYPPTRLRGFINVILSLDFLLLAVGPSIEWVYVGRVFRGIALGGGTLVWMLGALYYARTPEKVPIYLGVHTVLTGVRWALAPFAPVWMKAWFGTGARPIFWAAFLVVLWTALNMLWSYRRESPKPTIDGPPMPAPRTTGA